MLQCITVCCSVLQCVALFCIVLQCVAVCYSVLQCVTVYCSVLQCVAVCCSAFDMCICMCVRMCDTADYYRDRFRRQLALVAAEPLCLGLCEVVYVLSLLLPMATCARVVAALNAK